LITVELIHPPHAKSIEDRLDPPLGLLLIASHLRQTFDSRITVVINDLSGLSRDRWRIGEADIYGITTYVSSLSAMAQIARFCKQRNQDATVVIGGAHPTAAPESAELRDNADVDYVVVGDGEQAVERLVRARLEGNGKPGQDRVVHGGRLVEIPYPAYDMVNLLTYHRTVGGSPSLPYVTTRGCVYECAACGLRSIHSLYRAIRSTAPIRVFEDLNRARADHGVRAINIQDDLFTFDRERLYALLDLIEPLQLRFRCHGRAGLDSEEVYERLARAGCVQVAWGIESGCQKMLDRMNKRVTVEDNRNVIAWAKKHGITTRAFLILGFPGETKETIEETKRFILEVDPDQVFVSSMVCYPGTAVWQDPARFGVTRIDSDFDQFYQVDKTGLGGLSFDTQWLHREEFRVLEVEFRDWVKRNVRFSGDLLAYERKLYKDENP
jgi:anaerobic magnesium-protoporphyrin IX monomethyl ester cyclase